MTSLADVDASAEPPGLHRESFTTVGGYDTNETRFLNRELSWLAFDERVLALAADPANAPLDRLRYLAIVARNLDEFFQVRVAGLADQVAGGVTRLTADGRTPSAQLQAIRSVVHGLTATQEQIFGQMLRPILAENGVEICDYAALTALDRADIAALFEERVFPILTPLAIDPGHPFPYISDLSLNLAIVLEDGASGDRRYARLKVPDLLPRFVAADGGRRFVPLEQVIVAHIGRLFHGMDVVEHHTFRVTRNGDLTFQEEQADDLLSAVELELRRRRFGSAVRLEVQRSMTGEVRELLRRELDLDDDAIYETGGLIDMTGLEQLVELDRPDLQRPSWSPVTERDLQPPEHEAIDIFAALRRSDVLMHHPYSSFTSSVVEFLRQAANDKDVLAIKMTLYRTSGDSPIIQSLIRAAEAGKQVAVLIELKARFDEEANITWAKRLEQAGVHVAYGLVGLKIHSKACMVVRADADGIRRYCHIGTGNYNHRTARLYTDLGLLTADDEIGDDVADLFNMLTGYGRDLAFRQLLVAPDSLRPKLEELIREEMRAENGSLVMKMNSLVDPGLIDLLYEASQAGVQCDLIVRGICCLRPGVPGLSDNIRVRSIIGRYLEHSRVFRFSSAAGLGLATTYIGSADLMPRNLDRRIEVVAPIRDPQLEARMAEMIAVELADDELAWTLDARGVWQWAGGATGRNAHDEFQSLAEQRAGQPR